MDKGLNLWYLDYESLDRVCVNKFFKNNENSSSNNIKIIEKSEEKVKKKCEICKKKTGLDYFSCEDKIYCSNHRYHHAHYCNFDCKKNFEDKLRVENVKIIKDKLTRI